MSSALTPEGVSAGARPRVCVDLNVFVSAYRSLGEGRRGGVPQRVLDAILRDEIALVFSLNMAERLTARLEQVARMPTEEATVTAHRLAYLADPPGMLTRRNPIIALGRSEGAEEDARVLEAALAGRAEYLVTYNDRDFLPMMTPDHATGAPSVLGVRLVKPAAFATMLGWAVAPPTRQIAVPSPGQQRGGGGGGGIGR